MHICNSVFYTALLTLLYLIESTLRVLKVRVKTFQVQYEIGVEKLVLGPLGAVLEDHHPPIARERKALSNSLLEYDAARNKLARAREATAAVTDASAAASERVEREERLATELAEVETKLNNCRENVETLMLQFIAKEVSFCLKTI